MKNLMISILFATLCAVRPGWAQQASSDLVWVQIEAHPSLREAQDRARDFATELADVNGFSLGGSWYGIVLGPYTRDDANRVLQVYKSRNQIPQDSFIAFSNALGQQFWPIGETALNRAESPVTTPPVQTPEQATSSPSDETLAEARRSQQLLSSESRMDLQSALQAAGFYNSTIDGVFGPGTRKSMADWQSTMGFEPTGVLTTAQRRKLMDDYNAPLISVGMETVQYLQAGIEMQIPAGVVRFDRYEPPFVHFDPVGDLQARMLLISQPGTQRTLFGLYDIMQTLEIVPLNGQRDRSSDRFTLEGRNDKIVSYTQAELRDGEIKGFTLVWPTGDEARRLRVLEVMKASFTRTTGVLDPAAGSGADQRLDLVSGLQVRKPRLSRSGFYIDTAGTVVTTADAVLGCARITLDQDNDAEILTRDDTAGVAILRPSQKLAPMAVARLRNDAPRLQSQIAVAGFSYEGVLGAPTLTFGTLADTKGLQGETGVSRLDLAPLPGDAGGPVVDATGDVLGMLLSTSQSGRQLPENVSFAADAQAIIAVLDTVGIRTEAANGTQDLDPVDLTRAATRMTVLVSCWD